ncbi:hypothetical protein HDU97_005404 [Phlyctochytrium planicorne]|nr:hypothetical protein HDU97_005404 [Phlyctochytrium planicorne]
MAFGIITEEGAPAIPSPTGTTTASATAAGTPLTPGTAQQPASATINTPTSYDNNNNNNNYSNIPYQSPNSTGLASGLAPAGGDTYKRGSKIPIGASPSAATSPTFSSMAAAASKIPKTSSSSAPSRFWGIINSRKLKNVLRSVLCFSAAFAWILYDQTNTKLQPRSLLNMIIAVLVQNPSQTLGKFTDFGIINAIGLSLASAAWAIVNVASGYSYAWMGVTTFIFVYFFSIFRAISMRFFGFGLIGPLLCFTSVASTTGILGANTNGGDAFDAPFLRDTVYAFLVGFAVSLFANVFLWPEYAERYLLDELVGALEKVKVTVGSLVRTFSQESEPDETAQRTAVINELQATVKKLWELFAQVESEPRVSRLTTRDYKKYIVAINELVIQVSSIHKAIVGLEESLFNSAEYRENVAKPFRSQLRAIDSGCVVVMERIAAGMRAQGSWKGLGHRDEEAASATSSAVHTSIFHSLAEMENSQMSTLLEMLEAGISPESLTTTSAAAGPSNRLSFVPPPVKPVSRQESMLQVNFFILSFRQFAIDLAHLLSDVETPRTLGMRFFWEKYVPDVMVVLRAGDEDDGDVGKKPEGVRKGRFLGTVRRGLARLTGLMLRTESIYGFKCGCAVLIYMMVLFNQKDWYKNWYLQASFLTFLVAVAPSQGQSNLTFIINLTGAIIGYSFGYLTLAAWGTGVVKLTGACSGWFGCTDDKDRYLWGIWGFATFFAFPMLHVQLHTKLSVLGLLSLLSFATSVVGSFSNRQNPFYDDPYHRYYKLIASACMAITFAYIFCLFIYPNSARQRLRQSLSTIIRRLNALYAQILSTAYAPVDSRSTLVNDHTRALARMKEIHLDLYRAIGDAEGMMVFAAVEVKIRGRFRWATYKGILDAVKGVHERLGSAMAIVGEKPFDPYVRGLLANSLKKSRKDLQTVVRLILYLQSSALIAKQPLPIDVPSAQRTRAQIFGSVWGEMMAAVQATLKEDEKPQAPLRTASLLPPPRSRPVSMGVVSVASLEDDFEGSSVVERIEVSQEVDSITPLLKDLFGELSGFISPTTGTASSFAVVPAFDPMSLPTLTDLRAVPVRGHRGHDDEEEMYGVEGRESTERLEGIPDVVDENLVGAAAEVVVTVKVDEAK